MTRLTGWDGENAYCAKCFEGDGCPDMETSKCDFCEHPQAVYRRCAGFEDLGVTVGECAVGLALLKKQRDGLVVELPVAIGASVFTSDGLEWLVSGVDIGGCPGQKYYCVAHPDAEDDAADMSFELWKLGKTVFLTRAEAEKAMEGM